MTIRAIFWAKVLVVLPLTAVLPGQIYQGPSGGAAGTAFDDWALSNGRKDLSALYLAQDSSGAIECFATGYGANRTIVGMHGGSCDKIKASLPAASYPLAPDEYIVGISGRYGDRIDQLQIYTNHITQPAAGDKGGTAVFSYTAPHGQMIVAFTGRSSNKLVAIGVMYAPCTPDKHPCK